MPTPGQLPERHPFVAVATMVVTSLAATALLFRDVLGGARTLISNGDAADQSFAWLSKVFAATQERSIALWDFTTASGTSFIGELQTAPLYPVSVLFGLLVGPGDRYGIDVFLLLHFTIAAVGFQLLCCALRLSPAAGLLGAAVFAFGSTAAIRVSGQPNLFASVAWTPWVLWAVVRAAGAPRAIHGVGYLAAGAAATATAFLAGHVHAIVLAGVGAATLAAVSAEPAAPGVPGLRARVVRAGVTLLVVGAVAAALAAPQLAATIEYLRLSYKWYGPGFTEFPHVVPYEQFAAGSLHAPDLWTLATGQEVQAIDGGTLFVTWTGAALAAVAAVTSVLRRDGRRLVAAAAAVTGTGIAFAFSPVIGLGWLFYSLPGFNLVRAPARGLFLYAVGMALLAAIGLDRIVRTARRLFPAGRLVAGLFAAVLLAACGIEIHGWLPARVQRVAGDASLQVESIRHGPIAMYLRDLFLRDPVYRYYAPSDLVPPNLGNVHGTLSAHGYRSTRTRAYHDDFPYDPLDTRLDEYAVRWWVAPKAVPGLPVLRDFGTAVVHERPSALPVFWLARGEERIGLSMAGIEWRQNRVRVRFAMPVTGRIVFAQSIYPGWVAETSAGRVPVIEHRGLMATDVQGADVVTFEYAPRWWRPTVAVSLAGLALVVTALALAAWRRVARRPQ